MVVRLLVRATGQSLAVAIDLILTRILELNNVWYHLRPSPPVTAQNTPLDPIAIMLSSCGVLMMV